MKKMLRMAGLVCASALFLCSCGENPDVKTDETSTYTEVSDNKETESVEEAKIGDHDATLIYQTERGDGLELPETFSWDITYDEMPDYDTCEEIVWEEKAEERLTEMRYIKKSVRTNPFDGEQYEHERWVKQEYFGPFGRCGVVTEKQIASTEKSTVYAGIDASSIDTPYFKEYYYYEVVDNMNGHIILQAKYSTKDKSLISYYTVTEDYYSWGYCVKYCEVKANGKVIEAYEKHYNNFYEEQEVLPYEQ